MDGLNENPNEQQAQQPLGCLYRFSKTIKIVIIGGLILLLMIPVFLINNLISERGDRQEEAIDDVSQKWSLAQTVSGPYLNIQYADPIDTNEVTANDKERISINSFTLFPDELAIDGQLQTEILERGIYEVNVYQSELTMKGTFSLKELADKRIDTASLQLDQVTVCLNLSDMRGLSEQISINLGDSTYLFDSGLAGAGISIHSTGVHTIADLSALKDNEQIPYELKMKLKGSQSIHFLPLGKTTRIDLKGNWGTPSFVGNYLPEERNVTPTDFTAKWRILDLNRSYSQVMNNTSDNKSSKNATYDEIVKSRFGVDLKIPVEQYQQTMRTTKYAILIILLTFAVIFFTEILNNTRIHAFQYLLVGLALCLFYSLLLSFAEHLGFNPAYLLSAALTVILVGGYMLGIIRKKKPALIMAGLLTVLYLYIFVLIQLETYALLAGSLGLFVILALVMYFSKKIDWFNE